MSAADSRELGRWFAARLPFAPELPDIRGAQVVGGRLCTLQGNRFALAFFEKGGEVLSIFVADAGALTADASRAWAAAAERRRCSDAMNGYRVCYERRGRVATALVGPAEAMPPA